MFMRWLNGLLHRGENRRLRMLCMITCWELDGFDCPGPWGDPSPLLLVVRSFVYCGWIFVSVCIPVRVYPMLATLARKPVNQQGWFYEEKYDGYRILAYKEGDRVTLLSRK
jgi:ATP dependent DNA ligase domain